MHIVGKKELRRGSDARTDGQPFQVPLVLLDRPGRMMTSEELHSARDNKMLAATAIAQKVMPNRSWDFRSVDSPDSDRFVIAESLRIENHKMIRVAD